MYYFVNWKRTDEGFVPDLPDGIYGELFAEPAGSPTYGVYFVNVYGDEASELGLQPVSETLSELLKAAEQYAPALAVARDRVHRVDGSSREAFDAAYADCLRELLASQRESPYFLARATRDQPGYITAGSYYWIVGYRPDRVGYEVDWVSRDHFVYQDPPSYFDCDVADLERRFFRE